MTALLGTLIGVSAFSAVRHSLVARVSPGAPRHRRLAIAAAVACLYVAASTYLEWSTAFPFVETALVGAVLALGVWNTRGLAHAMSSIDELARSEARLRSLIDHAVEAVALYDPKLGRFVLANRAGLELFQVDEASLASVDPKRLFPPPRSGSTEDPIVAALETGVHTQETELGLPGGTKELEMRVARVGDGRIHVSLLDVAEERAARIRREVLSRELFHGERMETIGRLIEGITHDFNGSLTPILAYAELARERLEADSPALEDVDDIMSAAWHAKDMVEQLLEFSRGAAKAPRSIPIRPVIVQGVRFLEAFLSKEVRVEANIEGQGLHVMAAATQIHQILLNLGRNASDAMDAAGLLEIELVSVLADDPRVVARDGGALGWVRLRLTDTGSGMDESTMARVFEPFFSTKSEGSGTGLGLSQVQHIVTSLGGFIDVDSTQGTGSRFGIYLPVCEGLHEERVLTAVAAHTGGHHILLVDDDRDALRAIERLLLGSGHRVSAFDTPSAALAKIDAEKFDAAVLDYDLPEMDGLELASRLRGKQAGLPVLLISGLGPRASGDAAESGPFESASKPIRLQELRSALSRLMTEKS